MYRLAVPLLLVFFLLLIFALTLGQNLWVLTQIVRVTECSGPVEVRAKGKRGWSRLEKGATVKKGDYVRTRRGGYAVLSWVDGTRLMPAEDTVFEVRECQTNTRKRNTQSVFHLEQGKVWLRVRSKIDTKAGSRFEVSTPLLTASVEGTTFSVSATPDESSVSVREGRVTVILAADHENKDVAEARGVQVRQGESARVAKMHELVTGSMAPEEMADWEGRAAVLQPYLKVRTPLPKLIQRKTTTTVRGITDAGCTVTINGTPAVVETDGTFAAPFSLRPGKQLLTVVATSPEGLATTVTREVVCEPAQPGEGK